MTTKKQNRRNSNKNTTNYRVSITKRDDFNLDDAIKWMDQKCQGKHWYKAFNKHIVFNFKELDDAFKFKLHYEISY